MTTPQEDADAARAAAIAAYTPCALVVMYIDDLVSDMGDAGPPHHMEKAILVKNAADAALVAEAALILNQKP